MLLGESTFQTFFIAWYAVKRQAEERQGIQPLALHRTETEMYRQYIVAGLPEVVSAMQCAGDCATCRFLGDLLRRPWGVDRNELFVWQGGCFLGSYVLPETNDPRAYRRDSL